MPNINDLKKSNFLTKADVAPPKLVTIRSYREVNVALEGDTPENRWCLEFNELEKPMVLNSTNGQIIAQITGSEDFDAWIGKQIVLYNEPTIAFRGKLTGGIRVRAVRQNAPAAKPAVQPQVAPKTALAPAQTPARGGFQPDPKQTIAQCVGCGIHKPVSELNAEGLCANCEAEKATDSDPIPF
jgi:hypothetical protein